MNFYVEILLVSVMLQRLLCWPDSAWSESPWKSIFRLFLIYFRYILDSMWLPVECMPILIESFQFWWREVVTFSFINTLSKSSSITPSKNMTLWAMVHLPDCYFSQFKFSWQKQVNKLKICITTLEVVRIHLPDLWLWGAWLTYSPSCCALKFIPAFLLRPCFLLSVPANDRAGQRCKGGPSCWVT